MDKLFFFKDVTFEVIDEWAMEEMASCTSAGSLANCKFCCNTIFFYILQANFDISNSNRMGKTL